MSPVWFTRTGSWLLAVVVGLLTVSVATAQDLPAPANPPGWLGVGLRNVDAQKATGVPAPAGSPRVQVRHVFSGSAAEAAGIRRGDFVLAVDGRTLTGGVKEMVAIVKSHSPGQHVELKLWRDGSTRVLDVTLGTMPDRKKLVEKEWKGKPFPAATFRDVVANRPVELSDYAGHVVVVEYWATWCGPCKRAMPQLEALRRRLGGRGLRVVGVSDEDVDVIARFVRNRPIEYDAVTADTESVIASKLYVTSFPTFIVVDAKGKIAGVFTGANKVGQVEATVEKLLQ